MSKKAYFYIDDTIWVLRELTRTKPKSMFDVPLLKVLKTAHDKYGTKVQLNLFYRTDSFYGNDEFTLADVTDTYKAEWEASADWLKLAFHAKEEFPDYPHVNARYEDVFDLFKTIEKEVFRFAGEISFTYSTCPHWLPVSEAGVRALYDCGVRLMDITVGKVNEYDGNPDSLPYGHAARVMNNRQPETRVFTRESRDVAIMRSVCAYNHITDEQNVEKNTLGYITDEATGMKFKQYCTTCINLFGYDELEEEFGNYLENDYIGICDHEQYFYEDYFAYQPDYAEKIYKMSEILIRNGFEFIFAEDLIK